MADTKYTMSGEHHLQQFPNADQFLGDGDYSRPNWWELPDTEGSQGYAKGGSVISQLRKRKREPMPIHPAMRIPGVHIRTAEAGEPIFHGDE